MTGSGASIPEQLSWGVVLALACGVVLPMATLLCAGFAVKAYQCRQSSSRKRKGLLANEELDEET